MFGWLWKVSKHILIDRSNAIAARESLRAAAERIRTESLSVWVLPEGHRNAKPEMLPFKKGAFHLAIAAQVPVIPFATSPMWTVLDAHRWMVRPGVVRVRFMDPIPTAGMTDADVDRLSLAARAAIEARAAGLPEDGAERANRSDAERRQTRRKSGRQILHALLDRLAARGSRRARPGRGPRPPRRTRSAGRSAAER